MSSCLSRVHLITAPWRGCTATADGWLGTRGPLLAGPRTHDKLGERPGFLGRGVVVRTVEPEKDAAHPSLKMVEDGQLCGGRPAGR